MLRSTLPCPLYFATTKLYYSINFKTSDDQSFLYSIYSVIYNSNYALIQCFEEICLCIMSKDFRKLVKDQFVKNTQTNAVATTVYVSQALQQQRMRQLNIQRNNLVNNN
uniref:Transmembrane protein n=1 Tax=Meloidogyne javanica TaxID=6303 RepID=A0A915LI37_MELJA